MKKRKVKAIKKVKKVVVKLPKPVKPKKRPKYNQNSQIRSALRRAFSRSPSVQNVKNKARSEHPQYKKDGTLAKKPAVRFECALCHKLFMGKDIACDHIIPVIDIEDSFQDWNTFVDRLWCDEENLQMVCSYKLKYNSLHDGITSCHNIKTAEEKEQRKLAQAPSEK
jgi:5-methylcytosine-specific restriction endonuclease McrA